MVLKSLFLIIALGAIAWADTGFPTTISVTETDHAPQCSVGQLQFSTGTVTCRGQVAIINNSGGGGGSFTACGSNPSGLQFTDTNLCTWCETVDTSGVLTTALISCPGTKYMLMEGGTHILMEDGTKILTE